MKLIQTLLITVAMFISSQAFALAADHPASSDASAMQLAANEHQHDDAAAQEEVEGKGCKRGEGKDGCCCCKCCEKCCCKDGDKAEGSGCKRDGGKCGKDGCHRKDGEASAGDAHEGHPH